MSDEQPNFFRDSYHDDRDVRIEQQLSDLVASQKYVVHRVGKIDVSIRDLYGRTDSNKTEISEQKTALINHAANCPTKALAQEIATELKTSEKWKDILRPIIISIITAILAIIGTMVLVHAKVFIK